MKTNTLMLTLLAAIALPATAQEVKDLAPVPISGYAATQEITVKELADYTGLSERNVAMVVGARTPYAEYRTSFDRVERQFKRALGEERYNDLMAGRRIQLDDQQASSLASVGTTHQTRSIDKP